MLAPVFVTVQILSSDDLDWISTRKEQNQGEYQVQKKLS